MRALLNILALVCAALPCAGSVASAKGQQTTFQLDLFGRLTNKLDSLSNSIFAASYYAGTALSSNIWTPAGGTTIKVRDNVGNLLTNLFATGPPESWIYNSNGWWTSMSDGIGVTTRTYNEVGFILTEGGLWSGDTVTRTYTNRLRASLSISAPASTINYGYDGAKRLRTLSSSLAGTFNYGYSAPINYQPSTINLPNSASITNHFDTLARLDYTGLSDYWGHILDGYGYGYDLRSLRTNETRQLGLTTNSIAIANDNIGQITGWSGKESDGTPRLNEQLGFAYDPAHNLRYRTNNALVQTFTNNSLNQVTNISRTNALTVAGNTPAPATSLTVNGVAAQLYADFTFAATNISLFDGANSFTSIAQNVYGLKSTNTTVSSLPSSVSLSWDADGNARTDTTRWFEFDPAERMTAVTVSNAWRSELAYDGLSRRRIERDYAYILSSNSYLPTNEIHFIFDGLIPIEERWYDPRISTTIPLKVVTYTRGLDLSGTLGGAGGIGGLLARTDQSVADPLLGTAFYHADGAGNITALIDGYQHIAARYGYAPFGGLLKQSGRLALDNVMGFSSMPFHALSGIVLYWARPYDPNFAQFLSRDPIGEAGGLNLYRLGGNLGINAVDPLGLDLWIDKEGRIHDSTPPSEQGPDPSALDFQEQLDAQILALQGQTVAPVARGIGQTANTILDFTPQATFSEVALGETLEGRKVGAGERIGKGVLAVSGPIVSQLGKGGKLAKAVTRCKPVNLPKWKKVGINMKHVLSGHTAEGIRAIQSGRKDVFPEWMSEAQIEDAIRQAYRYGQKISSQGDRVLVSGPFGGGTIEMYVNTVTKTIESAWPK